VERLANKAHSRLLKDPNLAESEAVLYEDLVHYLLYRRYRKDLDKVIAAAVKRPKLSFWKPFRDDFRRYFDIPGLTFHQANNPAHVFACFFQIRRAFHHIFYYIIGASKATTRLRGAIWQSVFTYDMRRYARSLYDQMDRNTTLITGPSGTGKELVARALALSRYIPFDPDTEKFADDFAGAFRALNLSALPSTLIDSELFGHCEGAFTGATKDRKGWLELCKPADTLFLDEIGEVSTAVQVKLLRVLETRKFQRIGETVSHTFDGKLVAATNRDLAAEQHAGRFRQDFFFRICSDMVQTSSLQEQLLDSWEDLHHLVSFIVRCEFGDAGESLIKETETWIEEKLGHDYPWPGNVRELQQCVRNIAIHGEYHPLPQRDQDAPDDPWPALAAATEQGTLTAEQLLQRYCTLVYARTGSYSEAARELNLDRRTIQRKIDQDHLKAARRFWGTRKL
jgi:DNA-binding NtrC family response regulator